MVNDEEQYKWVTSQLRYFADRMRDNFKLYIQLSTAIIGGFVWLRVQSNAEKIIEWAQVLAPSLILLLGIFMSFQIWFDFWSWYRYRKVETNLCGNKIPGPSFPGSAWQEVFMTLVMLGTSILGFIYLK